MGVRSFDALGFDPAPGDAARTGDVAATVRAVIDALSEVEGILAGERDGRWEGKSAAAFRDIVADELTPRVQRALSSFSDAADALQRWVGQLESFQGRAQRLEERARAARDDLQAAQLSLVALPQPRHVAEDQPDDAQHDRDRAQGRVDSAHGVLAGILDEATSLRAEVEAAAGETAHRLDVSASSAPDEPGVFEQIGEALSDLGSWIASRFSYGFDWFMENVVPIIEAALPYIAFALAVAALFTTGGLGGFSSSWRAPGSASTRSRPSAKRAAGATSLSVSPAWPGGWRSAGLRAGSWRSATTPSRSVSTAPVSSFPEGGSCPARLPR